MKTINNYLKRTFNGIVLGTLCSINATTLNAEPSAGVKVGEETSNTQPADILKGVCPIGESRSVPGAQKASEVPFDLFFEKAPIGLGESISSFELTECPDCANNQKILKMKFTDGSEVSIAIDADEYLIIPNSKARASLPLSIEKSSNVGLPEIYLSFTGDEILKLMMSKLRAKKALSLEITGCDPKSMKKGLSLNGKFKEKKSYAKRSKTQERFSREFGYGGKGLKKEEHESLPNVQENAAIPNELRE